MCGNLEIVKSKLHPRYVPVFERETDSAQGGFATGPNLRLVQVPLLHQLVHTPLKSKADRNFEFKFVQSANFCQDSAGSAIKAHFDFLRNTVIIIGAFSRPTL